ncbi:MAG TPA: CRTAC1 family protein, partial [Opitutaceae bacterium]
MKENPAQIYRPFGCCAIVRCGVLAGLLTFAAPARGADSALREEPLSPRSAPGGATLFTEMPAAATGIVADNKYNDPRMWAELYQELVYGAIGSGVTSGDFDGDGRPDVFIVTKTGQGRLFRNLGGWRFEDVTERAGLAGGRGALAWVWSFLGDGESAAWTQGAAFADVNNDGRLDLYLCRFGGPNRLYINGGDGTFTEEATARGLALVDASGMAAFCDYDRDGWLDVYVQTNMLSAVASPEGQEDRLFRNNGDGTFADVTAKAGIGGITLGHSVVWWDHDADGWPDIYVANDYAEPDRLYRNNGDGTFTDVLDRALPRTPYYSMGSDLGDLDNDGRVDFLVADMAATTHEKDQRGMAGSRARAQEEPVAAAAAAQRMSNALYLATGTGRFLEVANIAGLAASDWTWSVRMEDLDCDGRLDVIFTNGMVREYHNNDLLGRIMGAESTGESRRMVRASPTLAERNLAFRNMGDLRFEEVGREWGLAHEGVSFGASFADFDGDGDLDLVVSNHDSGATVLRNDTPGGNRLVVALRGLSTLPKALSPSNGTRSNRFGVGAKVRITTASGVQVRELSAARGYLSSSEPVAHFGLGEESRISELTVEWPGGHVQRFGDIAANQRLTITEPDFAPE